jgi:hypothetical protein
LSGAAASQFNAELDRAIPNPTEEQLDAIASLKANLSEKLQKELKALLLKKAGGAQNQLSNLQPITVKDVNLATGMANQLIKKDYLKARARVQSTGRSQANNDEPINAAPPPKQAITPTHPRIQRQQRFLFGAGGKAQTHPAQPSEDAQFRTASSTSSGRDFGDVSTTPPNSSASTPRSDRIDVSGDNGPSLSTSSFPEVEVEAKTTANPSGTEANRLDG